MKVAINIFPLKSAHKDRGIGFYTSNLIEHLRKDPQIKLQEFTELSEVKYADIVHYPWFDFFFHTLPVKKRFKTVITIHDVIPLLFPKQYPLGFKGRYNFFLQKWALKNCRQVITDSEVSKLDIKKTLKIGDKGISVVHLAPNKNFRIHSETTLIYTKRKYNLPDRFLLYVGDANWIKNLPFLIESFYKISKLSDFQDVKLILVGGVFLKKVENINHPELASLKKVNQLIKDLDLERNVLKPGDLNLEELVSFYNLATIYIQPSLYEGFGLPIIEAFSCGTPVISSNRGSLPEVGGNAAVYFDPTNLNQFKSIVVEILNNPSLQNKLSKLGQRQAKKFSWDKAAEETKQVYIRVIKND